MLAFSSKISTRQETFIMDSLRIASTLSEGNFSRSFPVKFSEHFCVHLRAALHESRVEFRPGMKKFSFT